MDQQEYYDSHPNYYTDYSTQALLDRGKFLTEVIDKIPNKSSYKDIEELPKDIDGKYVITWGPSAGKTTAIRQFIVNHALDGTTGIISTKLIKDVTSLYYDIISQMYYLKSLTSNKSDLSSYYDIIMSFIVSFTSKSGLTIPQIRKASWVICTHERLFIEPSSILFTRDIGMLTSIPRDMSELVRRYLFIDEYPSTLYKTFDTEQLYMLQTLDDKSGARYTDTAFGKSIARSNFIDKVYDDYDKTRRKTFDTALVNNLPTPTNQSIITDVARGLNSVPSTLSKERVKFFADILANKSIELLNKPESETKEFITYSISDLPAMTTYLFDGTGDLLMRDSSLWKVISNPKFSCKLSLINDKITLVNNSVTRKMSNDEISSEYINLIDDILKSVNNEKLLVYLWKGSKKLGEHRDSLLINTLKEYYKDRVSFVSYQSGLERVTSKFIGINNVLILGKFFIPPYVISTLNDINKSKITTYEYTMSLIIQFIYRSSARKGSPIRLFIDKSYSGYIIKSLLSYFSLDDREVLLEPLTPEPLPLTKGKLNRRNKLFKILQGNDKYHTDDQNVFSITNEDLAETLGISYVKNSRLKRILSSLEVDFSMVEGYGKGTGMGRGNGVKSIFTIVI